MADREKNLAVVQQDELIRFCTRVLINSGLAEIDARLVSDSLVESNLRGVDSHGIARLPHYIERIRAGSIEPNPPIRVEQLDRSAAHVDGGHGLGQLVMWRAAGEAIRLARKTGAGWVTVANSSHCGAMSYYGLRVSDAGMIGLAFTHVDPMVVPYGSAEPFCGTNPICLTAPGKDGQGLCLDMATSVRPWNAIKDAQRKGQPIPSGWAVDRHGRETCRPEEVAAIAPMGDYKGSGLGLLIDVLCALLSNSPYGPDIPKMYGDLSQRRRLGGLIGAINISTFLPVDQFQQRLSEMIARWGTLKPKVRDDKVLYPGAPEVTCRRRRLRDGIPLDDAVTRELNALAADCGVPPLQLKLVPNPG